MMPMMPEATTANNYILIHPPPSLPNGRTNKTGNRASLQSTESSEGKQGTDWLFNQYSRILTNQGKIVVF